MNIQDVIDLLNRAELYEESSAVLAMVEQNKDMLEALKTCKQYSSTDIDGDEVYCYTYDAKKVTDSIEKAEVVR